MASKLKLQGCVEELQALGQAEVAVQVGAIIGEPVVAKGRPRKPHPFKVLDKAITWYGSFFCDSRGQSWTRRVKMDLETDDVLVAGAVLAEAGYFGKKHVQEEWEHAKEVKDANELQFFWLSGNVNSGFGAKKKTKTGAALVGEEWYGGVGQSESEATQMYGIAAVGEGEEKDSDW